MLTSFPFPSPGPGFTKAGSEGLVNKPKAASTPAPKPQQTGSAASKPAAVASEQKGGGEDGKPKTKSAYQLFCDEKRSEVKGE